MIRTKSSEIRVGRPSIKWLIVSAITIGTLTASACGSAKVTAGKTTGSLPSGASISVAEIINLTGPGSNGEDNAGKVLTAWQDSVNSRGGIGGHSVKLVVADTKGDALTAISVVRRVISDRSVVAAVLFDAETEGIYANLIAQAHLPVIGGMGYDPRAWNTYPNWLSITTSFPAVIDMAVVMGKNLNRNRVALAVCAEYPTCEAIAPLVTKASAALGVSFAGLIKASASAPDYTAECLQIAKNKVDYVMLSLASTQADMRLVAACKTQGYAGGWGIWDGSVYPKAVIASDPGVSLNVGLTSFPWFLNSPGAAAYRTLMNARGVPRTAWADPHGTAAYATMELFKKALSDPAAHLPIGSVGRDDIIRAYGTVKQETLGGLLPQPLTFASGKPEPHVNCYWIVRFDHGNFTAGGDMSPVCDPPALG